MKKRFKTVLFDFDGTLADTSKSIGHCFCKALVAYGFDEVDESEWNALIGPPLVDSFSKYTDEQTARAMVDKYREYYTAGGMFECELYDGVCEMLEALDESGITMAIVSSKPGEYIVKLLAHLGIDKYFSVVSAPVVGHINPSKCELINSALNTLGAEKSTSVMVGDRCYDVEGAVLAGVTGIGVTYGFGNEAELKEFGADILCQTPKQISELILQ